MVYIFVSLIFLVCAFQPDNPTVAAISDVIEPLDKFDAHLNAGWSAAKTLYIARQDILPQKAYLG